MADIRKRTTIGFIKKQIGKEAKAQWLNTWNSGTKQGIQYRKHISDVNLSDRPLKELRKIDRLTFPTFIQLKIGHGYFKSYLHRLSEDNSNKCCGICNVRQTPQYLLLNCRHYRAEQIKLKGKTQLKKHRHYIDAVRHQDGKNRNTRVFEKHSHCDKKMVIRNRRVEGEGAKGRRNGITVARV